MTSAATIVLPVHNVERTLASTLRRMLEMAEAASQQLQVVVVDDGSNDGTYEAACEAARRYPQIHVLRQALRSGLGPALAQVRRRMGIEQVVVHDGLTEIDVHDLAAVLATPGDSPLAQECRGSRRQTRSGLLPTGSADRRSGGSFRWLRLDEPLAPRRRRSTTAPATTTGGVTGPLGIYANTFAMSSSAPT